MAVAAYIFRDYNAHVIIEANGTQHDLRVGELVIKAVPYVGSGSTVVKLFNGAKKFKFEGWEYQVELSWNSIEETEHAKLQDCILDMITQGDNTNGSVLYPRVQETSPGVFDIDTAKTIEVIPELTDDAIQAIFTNRIRNRRASLKLVSFEEPSLTLKDWLV